MFTACRDFMSATHSKIQNMNRWPIDLVWLTIHGLNAFIFYRIIFAVVAADLFPPIGGLLIAGSILGPCLEKEKVKKAIRVIEYLPTAIGNVAIFACKDDPEKAETLFAISVGASGAVFAGEMAMRYFIDGDRMTKDDYCNFVLRLSKTGAVCATMGLMVAGKMLDLSCQVVSGMAAGLSALEGLRALTFFGMSARQACCPKQDQTNHYRKLADVPLDNDRGLHN